MIDKITQVIVWTTIVVAIAKAVGIDTGIFAAGLWASHIFFSHYSNE